MRTFVGIDLPENIKESLKEVIDRLKKIKEAKPVKIENLHITLKFLGEVEGKGDINKIKEKLEKCALDVDSFDVEVKGIGVFPSEKRVRVLWIGAEDEGYLKKLNEKIEQAMNEFGFKKEKDFISHITIARFKSIPNLNFIKEISEKYNEFLFGKFRVISFQLFESKLMPEGPIYKVVAEFQLRQ
ncbi:MAG: RNA 2',3'-cyclic phosphodiesterase [Candidatus Omnitrophica bacterium]|nr:RNA 2',3'-cyclic phosphodiesterase [Candidatus Omnitrophota bacterium]MCM8802868.1 RNA 2',3'-cyclic phosphodiesterase [Candidatus Omnitrophota bacterium]